MKGNHKKWLALSAGLAISVIQFQSNTVRADGELFAVDVVAPKSQEALALERADAAEKALKDLIEAQDRVKAKQAEVDAKSAEITKIQAIIKKKQAISPGEIKTIARELVELSSHKYFRQREENYLNGQKDELTEAEQDIERELLKVRSSAITTLVSLLNNSVALLNTSSPEDLKEAEKILDIVNEILSEKQVTDSDQKETLFTLVSNLNSVSSGIKEKIESQKLSDAANQKLTKNLDQTSKELGKVSEAAKKLRQAVAEKQAELKGKDADIAKKDDTIYNLTRAKDILEDEARHLNAALDDLEKDLKKAEKTAATLLSHYNSEKAARIKAEQLAEYNKRLHEGEMRLRKGQDEVEKRHKYEWMGIPFSLSSSPASKPHKSGRVSTQKLIRTGY